MSYREWTLPVTYTEDSGESIQESGLDYVRVIEKEAYNNMKLCVHSAETRIKELEDRLTPGSMNERAPTVWAYDQACKLLEKKSIDLALATDLIEEMVGALMRINMTYGYEIGNSSESESKTALILYDKWKNS